MKLLKLTNLINLGEDMLFPSCYCPVCNNESLDGNICNSCKQYYIKPKYCKICGEHLEDNCDVCVECKDVNRIFTQNSSVFNYNKQTSGAILKFKNNGAKYLAKKFAKILYDKYVTLNWDVDLVCPVPSHITSIKKRGYNHAAEIAKEFCSFTGKVYSDILLKNKQTPQQKDLGREARLKNLVDTFEIIDKWLVKNRTILVIDDVFTTGSTLSACAKVLKNAGAKNIYGLTLAKSPIKI